VLRSPVKDVVKKIVPNRRQHKDQCEPKVEMRLGILGLVLSVFLTKDCRRKKKGDRRQEKDSVRHLA